MQSKNHYTTLKSRRRSCHKCNYCQSFIDAFYLSTFVREKAVLSIIGTAPNLTHLAPYLSLEPKRRCRKMEPGEIRRDSALSESPPTISGIGARQILSWEVFGVCWG